LRCAALCDPCPKQQEKVFFSANEQLSDYYYYSAKKTKKLYLFIGRADKKGGQQYKDFPARCALFEWIVAFR